MSVTKTKCDRRIVPRELVALLDWRVATQLTNDAIDSEIKKPAQRAEEPFGGVLGPSRGRDLLDRCPAIRGDPKNLVREVADRGEGSEGRADIAKLLVARGSAVFEHDDAGVKVAGVSQLEKVVHVRGDQHAVFVEGAVEHLAVRGRKEPAVSNVAGVYAVFVRELLGHLGRDVLIEQKLHGDDRHGGKRGCTTSQTRCLRR